MSIEKEQLMKQVSVGLYCHTDDEYFEKKIEDIRQFLTKNGGECKIHRTKVSKRDANMLIEFKANIPEWFTRMHHAFDSKLNSTTNGFGVAWVE